MEGGTREECEELGFCSGGFSQFVEPGIQELEFWCSCLTLSLTQDVSGLPTPVDLNSGDCAPRACMETFLVVPVAGGGATARNA